MPSSSTTPSVRAETVQFRSLDSYLISSCALVSTSVATILEPSAVDAIRRDFGFQTRRAKPAEDLHAEETALRIGACWHLEQRACRRFVRIQLHYLARTGAFSTSLGHDDCPAVGQEMQTGRNNGVAAPPVGGHEVAGIPCRGECNWLWLRCRCRCRCRCRGEEAASEPIAIVAACSERE